MFFGSTAFAQTAFSEAGFNGNNAVAVINGNQFNIAIGDINTIPEQKIGVTGNRFNLATNPVSVITWNQIPPGVSQIWIPIDPDA